MGIGAGTAALIGTGVSLLSGVASYAMTPKAPRMDATNYELLRQTQEQANAESDAARARIEEARKREALRRQQMFAQDVKTSEVGAETVGVRNQVLGKEKDDEKDGVL